MLKYKIIFDDNKREFPVEGSMEIYREHPGCEILVRCQGRVIRTGIQDGNVSRLGFHVSLRPEPDRLVIQDLGSSWGTYLDGEPLDGWSQRCPSRPVATAFNCRLKIGATTLLVQCEPETLDEWIQRLDAEATNKLRCLPVEYFVRYVQNRDQRECLVKIAQLKYEYDTNTPLDKAAMLRALDKEDLAAPFIALLTCLVNLGREDRNRERLIQEEKENAAILNQAQREQIQQLQKLICQLLETFRRT